MLYARIPLLIVAAVLCSCARVSRDEAAVIGTWREESADAIMRYSFTNDHQVAVCFPESDAPCDASMVLHGKWWLRGDTVVYKLDWTPLKKFGDVPQEKEQSIPLARFREHRTVAPYFRRVDERI